RARSAVFPLVNGDGLQVDDARLERREALRVSPHPRCRNELEEAMPLPLLRRIGEASAIRREVDHLARCEATRGLRDAVSREGYQRARLWAGRGHGEESMHRAICIRGCS